ncbi:MAG: transposase [Kiritimatiellae bacterium]|nr:transposase [Kiritimatiellia bacterium]
MKTRECVKDPEDSPMYRLGRHWNTIQAYLIPGIEDDIGELGEDLKRFTQTCELLINDAMFAKHRWCGNGRPPHSRVSLFKAYILKAMRNYPYTTTLIAAIRESPSIRRLCGWESVSDIPHESQFSRAFRDFAGDDIGSKALAGCLREHLGRNGVMHASHDSSQIVAREKGATRKKDAAEAGKPAETRIERQQRQDESTPFASARRHFSSSMVFSSASLSQSGKRLRWIVCQWLPKRYLPPLSPLSSMLPPRQAALRTIWDIPKSKSTRSTRSTRLSKQVLQLPQMISDNHPVFHIYLMNTPNEHTAAIIINIHGCVINMSVRQTATKLIHKVYVLGIPAIISGRKMVVFLINVPTSYKFTVGIVKIVLKHYRRDLAWLKS